MGVAINNKSTTTEPPPYNGQQPKPPRGLNEFYWYQIFALDSAGVEVQKLVSLHGSLLTIAMYHHGKHSKQINTLFFFCTIKINYSNANRRQVQQNYKHLVCSL